MKQSASEIPQLQIGEGHVRRLPDRAGLTAVHVFDADSIDAVNAALAAGRPLLLRGEPGTGKSQLAHAVAAELSRPLVPAVIDSRVEARDLLYRFDAVARLAAAQIAGALGQGLEELAEGNFVNPGPLWWAFDWGSAEAQRERFGKRVQQAPPAPARPKPWNVGDGVVVLIDEIDKADPDVPNGLLEALGDGRFTPLGAGEVVMQGKPPLVVITSNEERALPDAFVRRCLVLELSLPRGRERFVAQLARTIGPAHFGKVDARVLERAAELLFDDRAEAQKRGWPLPGQAEYLDLVRAVTRRPRAGDAGAQREALERLARFAYRKQPGQSPPADEAFEDDEDAAS